MEMCKKNPEKRNPKTSYYPISKRVLKTFHNKDNF